MLARLLSAVEANAKSPPEVYLNTWCSPLITELEIPPTDAKLQFERITKSPLLASLLESYQVKKALATLAPAV